LLNVRRPGFWLLIVAIVLSLFGGFRSFLVFALFTLGIIFYLEGLHRTRYMPVAILAATLTFAGVVAFAQKLPSSVQRSLSVLPLVQVDPVVEYDARNSSEWRIEMWKLLLPELPKHLLLGKGLSIDRSQLETVMTLGRGGFSKGAGADVEGYILSGDFHNGLLTILIPFGIWGGIGLGWLFVAGARALYLNFRYGDPGLVRLNTFLYAYFLAKVALYLFVFGNFYSDLAEFAGILGLSVALNNGVRKPVPSSRESEGLIEKGPLGRPRLLPGFSLLRGR